MSKVRNKGQGNGGSSPSSQRTMGEAVMPTGPQGTEPQGPTGADPGGPQGESDMVLFKSYSEHNIFLLLQTTADRSGSFKSILLYFDRQTLGFNSSFMSELNQFLFFIIRLDEVIIVGDFKVQINNVAF